MSNGLNSGLEGAPDIMLLTMAALMVAILWLAAQSHETALPPIDLPASDAAGLGQTEASSVAVTLRPGPEESLEVFVGEQPLSGGLQALPEALAASGSQTVTLRADAGTRWESALEAMGAAAKLGLSVSVAVDR